MKTKLFEFFPIDNFDGTNIEKVREKEKEKVKEKVKVTEKETEKEKEKVSFWKKWGNTVLLVFFIIVIPSLLVLSLKHPIIRKHIKTLISFLRDNHSITTYSLFILFLVLMSLITSNTTIPNLMSGMIYGTFKGSILTSIGVLISGSISFLISRFMIRDKIQNLIKDNNFLKKYYNIIINSENKINEKNMLEFVFLSRLAPISPFHTFSYFWGITNVKYWIYLIGTLGVVPSLVFETFLGSQIGNIDEIFENKTKIFHIVIIIILSIIVGWVIERLINKLLNKKKNGPSPGPRSGPSPGPGPGPGPGLP